MSGINLTTTLKPASIKSPYEISEYYTVCHLAPEMELPCENAGVCQLQYLNRKSQTWGNARCRCEHPFEGILCESVGYFEQISDQGGTAIGGTALWIIIIVLLIAIIVVVGFLIYCCVSRYCYSKELVRGASHREESRTAGRRSGQNTNENGDLELGTIETRYQSRNEREQFEFQRKQDNYVENQFSPYNGRLLDDHNGNSISGGAGGVKRGEGTNAGNARGASSRT